jgi:LysM repeat protein
MRKLLLSLGLSFLILFSGNVDSKPKAAPENLPLSTPSEIIAAINKYRTQNGLPALQINNILMGAAQNQANYQASIQSVTHTGAGGTNAKERAIAAGYGGGSNIFLSEIIYGGATATVEVAMTWWKGSPVHNTVMLTSTYSEIGAGVATDGSSTYFTAELGSVAGGVLPEGSTGGGSSSNTTPIVIAAPVVISTPREDGSVVHVIQPGQALWTLAAVYEVDLQTLLDLNGLPETALVFPGDEIIISPPYTPTPGATEKPTRIPPTHFPTRTPTKTVEKTLVSQVEPDGNANLDSSNPSGSGVLQERGTNPTVRWIVIAAFAILFLVIVGSMFFQKQPDRPPNDDVVR